MDLLQDPLDQDDFDPVQYINQRFPTEASLDDLDSFVLNISTQISGLDEEISKAVQNQSLVGNQATKDIEEAQQFIEDLFLKIDDIKVKATHSEEMVQDLCADIKRLDYAKNHLQTSITSLNRLQMLINAVSKLEISAAEFHYKEAALLLDAVKQFMSHFEKYQHISVILDLNRRVDLIRKILTRHLLNIFAELEQNIDTAADTDLVISLPGGVRALTDCCQVVDALGVAVRRQLLTDFVHKQLQPYEKLFGYNRPHFTLDQVERRWAWFKRLLKYMDVKFINIFPGHWRVELRLCLEFIDTTKLHLIQLLSDMENAAEDGSIDDVNLLLKALQSTIRFEQEMAEKFHLLKDLKASLLDSSNNAAGGSSDAAMAALLAKAQEVATQKQLKNADKLMYIPTDHDAENSQEENESGFLSLAHTQLTNGISGVFDKFLRSYVNLERQNLEDMLTKLSSEEDNTTAGSHSSGDSSSGIGSSSQPGAGQVYASATNMFVFIKNSIKRCTALTTGQTFLALSEELCYCMKGYITMLKTNRCPPEVHVSGAPASVVTFKLQSHQELTVCFMINTGEYCSEVVPQLEQMVQGKIVPSLANKVDFTEVVDDFMDLVAHGLKVLVYGLLDRMEPSFRLMYNSNWSNFTQVGEESPYVHTISNVLLEAIPKIRQALSSTYFNNFVTKLATEMLHRFSECIMKQKQRISDLATQQLLLDTYAMKTLVLQLPILQAPNADGTTNNTLLHIKENKGSIPAMYTKLVNTKSAQIEMLLKLIGTPEPMLLERFKLMWPEGQSSDLQLIMTLKGMKRDMQSTILETLGVTAAAAAAANKSVAGAGTSATGNNKSPLSTTPMGVAAGANQAGSNSGGSAAFFGSSTASYTAASAQAASVAAFSSMKSLTQDLSFSARSAVTNLKWSSNNNNNNNSSNNMNNNNK